MKIALVHEYLNQLGGAERVLKNFLEIWPDSVLHVLIFDSKKTNGEFDKYTKKISFLDKLPLAHSHPRLLVSIMPIAIEHFDFSDFDVVISDSSSFAKGIKTDKLHICYCHAPTRYLWTVHDYLSKQQYPEIFKQLGKPALVLLKKWDYKASQRPDFIIANSKNIQNQIKKFYDRDSVVISPPVDTSKFYPDGEKQNYFLATGRLEPYKKVDVIISAFNELGLPLKVAGSGTILKDLKKIAKPNVQFVGPVNDDELRKLYSNAKAYVFAAEEDAGIMIVEAQACGTPVIAYGKGGALETIQEGITGEFFTEQSKESLIEKIKNFDSTKYNPTAIRENALQYDNKIFQKKIKDFVEEKYANRT
ncbi:MAG: glycosyltransferase [Candidatus Doudnabacteria bacterium]|nr:glycosyltransferase [Candidatus Doudnabacteria bacterium]